MPTVYHAKPVSPPRPAPGPLAPTGAAWLMSSPGARSVRDHAGKGRPATLGVAAAWGAGPWGPCLSCNGAVACGIGYSVPVGTTFWTAMWIRPGSQVGTYAPLFNQGVAKGLYLRQTAVGQPSKLNLYQAGDNLAAVALVQDEWSHVVVSVRAGAWRYYYNGVDVTVGTPSGWTGMTATTTGGIGGSESYVGLVDSVLFANGVALSPSQARDLYADHWSAFRPPRPTYSLISTASTAYHAGAALAPAGGDPIYYAF